MTSKFIPYKIIVLFLITNIIVKVSLKFVYVARCVCMLNMETPGNVKN